MNEKDIKPEACCPKLKELIDRNDVWLVDGSWTFPVDAETGPLHSIRFCPYCGIELQPAKEKADGA